MSHDHPHRERDGLMPSQLRRDSVSTRAAFHPEAQDIARRVYVAVMDRSALAARPASYFKVCDTFRATDATAFGTHLSRESLARFGVFDAVPNGFVSQHRPERTPTGIQHRLRHFRLGEFRCRDISNHNAPVGPHEVGGSFVQMIAPTVCDLGMDGFHARSIAGPLRHGQGAFVLPIVLKRRDRFARAARRQRLEAQVYTDSAYAECRNIGDICRDIEIPAPSRVLRKRALTKLIVNRARKPDAIIASQVTNSRAPDLEGSWDQWDPSKCAPRTIASPKARTPSDSVARLGELPADGLHCVGVQPKISSRASAKLHEIEGCRPAVLPLLSLPLHVATVIPNDIHRSRVALKMPSLRAVFDAVAVGDQHVWDNITKTMGMRDD